jgi:hypothetical protein
VYIPSPSTATNSVYIPSSNLRIPLHLDGKLSYIPTHYPSTHEIKTCKWVELTSSEPWDPKSNVFAENEEHIIESFNTIQPIYDQNIASYTTYNTSSPDEPPTYDFDLPSSLTSPIRNISVTQSNTRSHSTSLCSKISHIFRVGLETARRTLSATTQLAL